MYREVKIMLAYMCRHCGQFTVLPLKNEFEEHFCSQECYEKYCESHQYAIHLDRLVPVKNALQD